MGDKKHTAMDVVIRFAKIQRECMSCFKCPRCGRNTMKPNLYMNALSRRAEIYICSDCGSAEALADYFEVVDDVANWNIVSVFARLEVDL